ncbi:Energy-coupling factor transporter transmembrane protein EcfT [Lutibacter agarilyticus]|uniref:Energy-coupling factor transporter transmembrane protein EcfT n=1 Tax=Lutibacter agarilyticus TaxID=1109740 RepID=A0A238WZ16_9FLAO|nr:CbiQ family ECF transporter T component [Lutibacter agarilyticus]SNR51464.1 Energy-coupling factor transporter transmembrane protein EcfT [Lutibacter agarilyticus]
MLIKDLYNYNHKLVKTPVVIKSLYVLPAFILSIISTNIFFHIGIVVIFLIAIIYVTQQSILKLLKLFLIPSAFIFIGCLTLLVSINLNGNWHTYIYFNKETLPVAISILFRSYAIVSVVYFWLLTHTISEIAEIMFVCKITSLFIELFVLIYKFIHMLMYTTKTMLIAQKCRMGYASIRKNSINSFVYLFGAVFKQSMLQTSKIEIAMDSRLGNNEYLFVKPKLNFDIKKITIPLAVNMAIVAAFIISII